MEILARLEAATTTICVHSTLSRTPCRTCLCVGLASLPDCRKRVYICAISCLLATVDCPILVLCNMPVHSCCGCDGRTVRSQQLQSLDGNAVNWTAIAIRDMLVIGNYNQHLGTNCLTTAEEQTQLASAWCFVCLVVSVHAVEPCGTDSLLLC